MSIYTAISSFGENCQKVDAHHDPVGWNLNNGLWNLAKEIQQLGNNIDKLGRDLARVEQQLRRLK